MIIAESSSASNGYYLFRLDGSEVEFRVIVKNVVSVRGKLTHREKQCIAKKLNI